MRSVTSRSGHGAELVFHAGEIAADQREQVGGLGMRIVPDREMAPRRQLAAVGEVAIGKQHRRFLFIGFDPRGVDRHHVGPVGEVGDAAEAFRLALRAIGATRAVEAGELSIGRRIDQGLDLQRERPVRRLRDSEAVRRRRIAFRRQRGAIELERGEGEAVAVEHQRRGGRQRVGLELQRRAHLGLRRMQRDIEMHGFHQPVGRAVILQADGLGNVGAHELLI